MAILVCNESMNTLRKNKKYIFGLILMFTLLLFLCIVKGITIHSEKHQERIIFDKYTEIINKYSIITDIREKTQKQISEKLEDYQEYIELNENEKIKEGYYVKINFITYQNNDIAERVQERIIKVGQHVYGEKIDSAILNKNKGDRIEVWTEENQKTKVKILNVYKIKEKKITEELIKDKFGVSEDKFYNDVKEETIEIEKQNAMECIAKELIEKLSIEVDNQEIQEIAKAMVDVYTEEAAIYQESLYEYLENEYDIIKANIVDFFEEKATNILKEKTVWLCILDNKGLKKYHSKKISENNIYLKTIKENQNFKNILKDYGISWEVKE